MEKRKYGKLMGGFACPYGDKPAYAVLLGADDEIDNELKAHHLWLLDERQERTVSELVRYCMGLNETYQEQGYKIEGWYTGTISNAMAEYIYKPIKGKTPNIFPTELPGQNIKMGDYVNAIQEVIEVKRLLHIENSFLEGYLQNFPPDRATREISEFPPLAALGYVVRELSRWSKREVKEKKTQAQRIIDHVESGDTGDFDWDPTGHSGDDEDEDEGGF